MAAIRKPRRCDTCGAPLRVYVTIGDKQAVTEDAALCVKCKQVFKRPVCFGKCTLEMATDSKMVTTILKKIAITKEAASETVSEAKIIEKP